jgi:hypothetical protein
MKQPPPSDEETYRIATASIRRHSMNAETWERTLIGSTHPALNHKLILAPEERTLLSAYLSSESWYAFTTRRVISQFNGSRQELDPRRGIKYEIGDFKGLGLGRGGQAHEFEVAKITSEDAGAELQFEYETGKPSMAPVYACMFWSRATGFHLPQSSIGAHDA